MQHVKDKIVLVTGASRGVGYQTAKLFSKFGAIVYICSRNLNKISEAAKQISDETGYPVHSHQVNVSVTGEVEALFQKINEQASRLDICINNAGFLRLKPFIELTDEDWDESLNANLRSTFLCSRAAFKLMLKTPDTNFIVNVSSLSGVSLVEKFPKMSAYIASKSAVVGLTESLAVEGKPYNIRVNCIAPGTVATEMFAKNFADTGFTAGATAENIAKMIVAMCDPDGMGLTSGSLFPIYCNA